MTRKRGENDDARRSPEQYMREGGWSEDFAFIAGFTEGGAPFGTTWEEAEEAERRFREADAMTSERKQNPRTLRVDMVELEAAFETPPEQFLSYLDTETGRVLSVPGFAFDGDGSEEEQAVMELIDSSAPGRFLTLEGWHEVRPSYTDAREFIETVEDRELQKELTAALGRRRHAFRYFLDALHGEAGEWTRWHREARVRLREKIAQSLLRQGIALIYDPLPPSTESVTRPYLIAGAVDCGEHLRSLPGVRRIALIGSIVTDKKEPNDVDVLVTIGAEAELSAIARQGRKLKGYAQQINRGADIFLASETGRYLGRTCPWKVCGPGIRMSCYAQNCGSYLYDDLHLLTLDRRLIESPPIEVWPRKISRGDIPADVLQAFGITAAP